MTSIEKPKPDLKLIDSMESSETSSLESEKSIRPQIIAGCWFLQLHVTSMTAILILIIIFFILPEFLWDPLFDIWLEWPKGRSSTSISAWSRWWFGCRAIS